MILCSASEPRLLSCVARPLRRGTWKVAPLRLVSKRNLFALPSPNTRTQKAGQCTTRIREILSFVILSVRCVNFPKLWIANDETDLLNQLHELHENYTRYGYRSFSRSVLGPRRSG